MKCAMSQLRFAAFVLTVMATSFASACPAGVPPGLTAVAVGQDMVVDGWPLSVLQVRGRTPAAAVLAQVETAWRAAGYDVRRVQAALWQVLAARGDACLITLQLTDHGKAFGYLAVSRSNLPPGGAGPAAKQAMARLPVPPGAAVLTTVSSSDDGRKGIIAALTSGRTLEGLHGDVLKRLRADGWGALSSQVSLDRSRAPVGALVSARRGRERIEIVLWRDGATHAVINLADAL